ncbi:class I SAM-dependent methyltransferase [Aurantiacibacter marinus]|uniref:Methyltransferase domain-containing protein n=1 Tax=Aurantiacibacter marinus TaxID=874156 RepID=A0A0H0XQR3_9SPHN|nr:class I SAM-dependent methyltransferase [Aurantiacibacter marinus]KLI64933.1 hypothetical protein AAV99_05410 [Aurantiacibacter marinus]
MSDNYWNTYYADAADRAAPRVPSQFAAFLATELGASDPLIVDVGCGNGRDSHFFANCGFRVIGVDGSESAIADCKSHIGNKENIDFICADLADEHLSATINEAAGGRLVVLYARFFLHAITEEQEARFFDLANAICGASGAIAVEFRTNRDQDLSKVTATHFRRFVEPLGFLRRANLAGYTAEYHAEGFGYAKFRDDDAHVARFVLSPIS